MERFKGKYRIPSTRLPGWDYASAGYYFVTIVTHGRVPYFGNIRDGEMHLSPIGSIVADEWAKTPQIRPNVQLDEWIVMPNHLHGIIIITTVETPRRGVSTGVRGVSTGVRGVSTGDRGVSTNDQGDSTNNRGISTNNQGVSTKAWKPNTLGSIINQFKSVCTKRVRLACNPDFAWQSRFYDRIIRDEKSLERILAYIRYNPLQWSQDDENPNRPI